MAEYSVPRCTPLPSSYLMHFRRWRYARGREHCSSGEPGSTISGRYAPDSAKADDSSIGDEPGEG